MARKSLQVPQGQSPLNYVEWYGRQVAANLRVGSSDVGCSTASATCYWGSQLAEMERLLSTSSQNNLISRSRINTLLHSLE